MPPVCKKGHIVHRKHESKTRSAHNFFSNADEEKRNQTDYGQKQGFLQKCIVFTFLTKFVPKIPRDANHCNPDGIRNEEVNFDSVCVGHVQRVAKIEEGEHEKKNGKCQDHEPT